MGDMGFVLELTLIALAVLILISLLFIGLSAGLAWLARVIAKQKGTEVEAEKERRNEAIVAAALMSYLEAERLSAGEKGSASDRPNSMEQEGKNEEEIQDNHRG